MNQKPLDVALRHICETRQLLDTLITSSETFDYQTAKLALRALHKKSRELAKAQAALEHTRPLAPTNIIRLPA